MGQTAVLCRQKRCEDEMTIFRKIATTEIMAFLRLYCQEILIDEEDSTNACLNSDNVNGRIDLIADHILDSHQRSCQRARAASAGALVSYPQLVISEFYHLEPSAVTGKPASTIHASGSR